MKVMVLVTVVVMALSHVTGQSCFNRLDRKQLSRIRQETKCFEPQPSFVELKVPDGYDYVQPSVVKLNRCTGLACTTFPYRCLPVPGTITTQVYKVQAKRINGLEALCTQVEVEEHHACGCRCDPLQCDDGKVFNENECRCECDPVQEEVCNNRGIVGREQVMWSQNDCTCRCDRPQETCGPNAVWDRSVCRCIRMYK